MKILKVFLIISVIGLVFYKFSAKPYVNGNVGICIWPDCTQKVISYEGYVNGISEANNEAQIDKPYTENIPQGTYYVSFSYDDGVMMPPKPHFKSIRFTLSNLDDINYLINGKHVNKDEFLPKSFGSKVHIKAIEERSGQIDIFAGMRTHYKLQELDLIEELTDMNECVNCQTFSNEFMSFKYSSDWKVVKDLGPFITLRRSNYYTDELPNWCTVGNLGKCDCSDINKECAYEIHFELTENSRKDYENLLPLNKTHKVFSPYNKAVFVYADHGLDGPDFFAEGKIKNIYMTANMSGFSGGGPFPMENDSLMPYLILSTLDIKDK